MEMLIGCLAILFISASVIDWLLGKSTVDLQGRLREAGVVQERDRYSGVVTSANVLFCDLFDAVYGKKFLSLRRFLRSGVLSVLTLFFVALLIGLDKTFSPDFPKNVEYFTSYFASLAINLVADYISLQETRWVLGRARSSSIMGVFGWVCVDLLLTLGIFFAVFSVVYAAASAVALHIEMEVRTTLLEFLFSPASPLLDRSLGLPFLLSTFGTSVIWLLFVLFVLGVTAMRTNSRFLGLVFDAVAENPAPARAVAVVIAIPVVVVGLVLIAVL